MGHPDSRPSPERPYGWRGDGTGAWPGATPVIDWDTESGRNVVWGSGAHHALVHHFPGQIVDHGQGVGPQPLGPVRLAAITEGIPRLRQKIRFAWALGLALC